MNKALEDIHNILANVNTYLLEFLIQANLKIFFLIQFPWKWVPLFLVVAIIVAIIMTIPKELQKKPDWLSREEEKISDGGKISYYT